MKPPRRLATQYSFPSVATTLWRGPRAVRTDSTSDQYSYSPAPLTRLCRLGNTLRVPLDAAILAHENAKDKGWSALHGLFRKAAKQNQPPTPKDRRIFFGTTRLLAKMGRATNPIPMDLISVA